MASLCDGLPLKYQVCYVRFPHSLSLSLLAVTASRVTFVYRPAHNGAQYCESKPERMKLENSRLDKGFWI